MSFRVSALALALAGLLWFNFGQDRSAAAVAQRTYDLIDSRPARSILILGNSRIYSNSMPTMLREIADSAGSPTKLQIETHARPAYTFDMHWSDRRTRKLLGNAWDDVILQANSGAQLTEEWNQGFLEYGARLGRAAKLSRGSPSLVVGWACDPPHYEDNREGMDRATHLGLIRSMHARLANDAGMSTINLASLWETVRRSHPSIRLTTDGNHPTVAGTYLYALAVYAHLSKGPVGKVTYVPDKLDPNDAQELRNAVDAFPFVTS